MDLLARSTLPREVSAEGHRVLVRQPGVEEVAQIVSTALRASEGDAAARVAFFDVLRTWLPLRLYAHLSSRRYPTSVAVQHALSWAFDGAEGESTSAGGEADDKRPTLRDALEAALRLPLADMAADVAAAYGTAPGEVQRLPWLVFLAYYQRTERVEARRQYAVFGGVALTKYRDQNKLTRDLDTLLMRAGLKEKPKELTREEKIERSKRNLEKLARLLPNTAKHTSNA